jgi:rubrerythrin
MAIVKFRNALTASDKAAIQVELEGERSAAASYRNHASSAIDPKVKAKFEEIANEEDGHARELEELLNA